MSKGRLSRISESKSDKEVALLLSDFISAFESIQGNLVPKVLNSVFDNNEINISGWIDRFNKDKEIKVKDGNKLISISRN